MEWIWDPVKNKTNLQKHGISFATAVLVFDDPLALTIEDPYADEERWRTIGRIISNVVIVVHTYPEFERLTGEEIGRIISARKATSRERRAYEKGR
ncbi:MAG: BrnT family toxin [Caldilineaceae bacterium]|nr:BrnT family toxin [Caldilineaceae bacterium]